MQRIPDWRKSAAPRRGNDPHDDRVPLQRAPGRAAARTGALIFLGGGVPTAQHVNQRLTDEAGVVRLPAVASSFDGSRSRSNRSNSGPSAPRVLVAARDAALRGIARQRLTEGGFDVVATDDGLHALILAHDDPPDLIVVERGNDAFETAHVLRRLGGDRRTANVPVVVLEPSDSGTTWRVAPSAPHGDHRRSACIPGAPRAIAPRP